ncbi:hypothetical protein [Streptomyces sp. NPDC001502]|uniref:hypothetical protein n=1 Tax=Streptomyces sp. NPDC001502 TaxID=3364578 RepID=UPI003686B64E
MGSGVEYVEYADRTAHLSAVRDAAVPLPERLAALLAGTAEQLTTTTGDETTAVAAQGAAAAELPATLPGSRPTGRCTEG